MHIYLFLKKFRYFRHSEFQTPCSSFFVVQNRVKLETAKMSMHFYSTSQKVSFDMEADLFSAVFVIFICVGLESVWHTFVKHPLSEVFDCLAYSF